MKTSSLFYKFVVMWCLVFQITPPSLAVQIEGNIPDEDLRVVPGGDETNDPPPQRNPQPDCDTDPKPEGCDDDDSNLKKQILDFHNDKDGEPTMIDMIWFVDQHQGNPRNFVKDEMKFIMEELREVADLKMGYVSDKKLLTPQKHAELEKLSKDYYNTEFKRYSQKWSHTRTLDAALLWMSKEKDGYGDFRRMKDNGTHVKTIFVFVTTEDSKAYPPPKKGGFFSWIIVAVIGALTLGVGAVANAIAKITNVALTGTLKTVSALSGGAIAGLWQASKENEYRKNLHKKYENLLRENKYQQHSNAQNFIDYLLGGRETDSNPPGGAIWALSEYDRQMYKAFYDEQVQPEHVDVWSFVFGGSKEKGRGDSCKVENKDSSKVFPSKGDIIDDSPNTFKVKNKPLKPEESLGTMLASGLCGRSLANSYSLFKKSTLLKKASSNKGCAFLCESKFHVSSKDIDYKKAIGLGLDITKVRREAQKKVKKLNDNQNCKVEMYLPEKRVNSCVMSKTIATLSYGGKHYFNDACVDSYHHLKPSDSNIRELCTEVAKGCEIFDNRTKKLECSRDVSYKKMILRYKRAKNMILTEAIKNMQKKDSSFFKKRCMKVCRTSSDRYPGCNIQRIGRQYIELTRRLGGRSAEACSEDRRKEEVNAFIKEIKTKYRNRYEYNLNSQLAQGLIEKDAIQYIELYKDYPSTGKKPEIIFQSKSGGENSCVVKVLSKYSHGKVLRTNIHEHIFQKEGCQREGKEFLDKMNSLRYTDDESDDQDFKPRLKITYYTDSA